MITCVFICSTPREKREDAQMLAGYLGDMGYEVCYGEDFCSPVGQQAMRSRLADQDGAALVCARSLGREVFEGILDEETEFHSFGLEDDPRDLANTIHSEVTMGFHERIIQPAPLQKVLVMGGGVAGVYAALDLAEQDYQVVLVEKDPSIGGIMASLDKTFPTMDCSI